MNNSHLEAIAQSKLEQAKPLFEEVKRICDTFLEDADINNIEKYYEFQDVLTGIYGTLNTMYKELKAMKKNEEVKYYYELKIAAAANQEKFISASAEKEADYYVAPLRIAKDIFESYVETITMAINTCRSRIYEFQKDKKYDI